MALTDVAIKNAKAREKPYKMGDAGGLFLLVQPSGGKLWRLKYRVDGREKKLGIGTYPEVSLAEARKRRDDARELLAAGKDPSREKQRDKVRSRLQADNTFTAIAREFCDKRKRDGDKAWSTATAKRSEYLLSLLDRSIGRMAINEVEPPDVLAAIRKIEGKGNLESARRTLQLASAVFRYAVATARLASEAVNLSLFGTIQPQRIANLVAASTAKHDDGLIQRLQLLAWPDLNSDWVPADRPPNASAREVALDCCRRLTELTAQSVEADVTTDQVPFLRMTGEAQEAFKEYRGGLEAKVRGKSLPEPLASHLSKYRGLIPRLALILHLCSGGTGRVTADAMRVAVKWAHYLEQHARRMYGSVDKASCDTALAILRRIRNNELRDGFSQRDITQKGWSGLRDGDQVERALNAARRWYCRLAKLTSRLLAVGASHTGRNGNARYKEPTVPSKRLPAASRRCPSTRGYAPAKP